MGGAGRGYGSGGRICLVCDRPHPTSLKAKFFPSLKSLKNNTGFRNPMKTRV